ncbi:MAG: endolytic transglycosylase MltG [Candidatus Paceibacterota bacterium]
MKLFCTLGLFLLFIVFVAYFFYGLQPVIFNGDSSTENSQKGSVVKFIIEKGDGVKSVGAHLSQNSLIKSVTVFKLYMLISGKAQKLQPGMYELSPSMSVPEITTILTVGGGNEVTITIPEGSTVKDIRQILVDAGVWKSETPFSFSLKQLRIDYPFLTDVSLLEGFVFPDTYRIARDATPDDIVRVFLNNFRLKAWPLLEGTKDWYNTLMLASLLEREVPDFNDRQIVAGILLKRMKIKMPLQVDATISYAKCEGQLKNCEVLKVARTDTTFSSPYNTYQRLGWPPTPIANPGQAAIKAALTPKDTPYLYYLSAKTGETYFSKTLEEHNIKRTLYL